LTYGATRLMGSKWVATVRFVAVRPSALAGGTEGNEKVPEFGPFAKEYARSQAAIYEAMAMHSANGL